MKPLLTKFIAISIGVGLSFNAFSDYDMFRNNILSTPQGVKLRDNYVNNYSSDVQEKFMNYTLETIEVHMAMKLRDITRSLYASAIDKIMSDLSYPNDIPLESETIKVLSECIELNSKYLEVETQCVPKMLWDGGYKKYAECASASVKTTLDYCLGR